MRRDEITAAHRSVAWDRFGRRVAASSPARGASLRWVYSGLENQQIEAQAYSCSDADETNVSARRVADGCGVTDIDVDANNCGLGSVASPTR